MLKISLLSSLFFCFAFGGDCDDGTHTCTENEDQGFKFAVRNLRNGKSEF